MHLSTHNILCNCQNGFRKELSFGDLRGFLIESLLSSLRNFDETLPLVQTYQRLFKESGINISLLNYPLTDLLHSLCIFIPSFLSDRSIAGGRCGKSTNSSTSHSSILSPTLVLLCINDLRSLTQFPRHSYADGYPSLLNALPQGELPQNA